MKTVKTIKAEIIETRRYMKANGIQIISCMNGGLDRETWQHNAKLFRLKVELMDAEKGEANASARAREMPVLR